MPTKLIYPDTRRGDVVEEHFGVTVADPYRWLENDVREDREVADWVAAQNRVTNAYLETLPGRDAFARRLESLIDHERFGLPVAKGGRYFHTHNSGLQNQAALFVRETPDGAGRLLIDPNDWSADGAIALAEWAPSEDGAKIAYAVQDAGTDWRTVRVLDVAGGEDDADLLHWVKFSQLAWAKNGSGFFYSRFKAPAEGEAHQALNLNQTLYFHKLGTDQAQDLKVYATPDRPKLGHFGDVTDDGNWLVITSAEGTDSRYEITLIDLTSPRMKPMKLIRGLEHDWQLAGNVGSEFYFVTDLDASRGRIIVIDAASPTRKMRQIVPQGDDALQGAGIVGGVLIASYLVDARSEVRRFTLAGEPLGEVDLPGIGSASGFGGDQDEVETFFAFTSFATPTIIYRYDVTTGERSVWAEPAVDFDPENYVVDQHFFASKDGTRVPMFVVHKTGLTTPAPTLLYGYGGFDVSLTPGFSATRLAWMEQGGMLAVANLRGGGEYGKAWHDAGRLHNKQNVFDDCIAAAEHLIAQGLTTRDKLAIQGGSNGGLLVGAVINQRPDLFAAALPEVGVMDMLRFDRFTAGRYWVDDYGHPDRQADFDSLYAYSPYHNIRPGEAYPAVMALTADTDDRVVPGHSFKYVARLQHLDTGEKPHVIRIETRAGHGSGKPVDKVIAEYADIWAFAAHWTGMDVAKVG